jgi:hypothetical protein
MALPALLFVIGNRSPVKADEGLLHTLSLLGPIATGLVALVALTVGLFTVRQRREADRRDQWWKRAQWALDLVLEPSEDEGKATVGFAMLERLADSDLARKEELLILEAAWQVWLFPSPED